MFTFYNSMNLDMREKRKARVPIMHKGEISGIKAQVSHRQVGQIK